MRAATAALAAEHGKRRLFIAAALYALTTLLYIVTAGRERLAAHTPFNHFALLAEAWLCGRAARQEVGS